MLRRATLRRLKGPVILESLDKRSQGKAKRAKMQLQHPACNGGRSQQGGRRSPAWQVCHLLQRV
jgi:hypothetical protein